MTKSSFTLITVSSWQLLMLICHAAAAVVPTPYPAVVKRRSCKSPPPPAASNIPSLVPWLVPPDLQKTGLPSPFAIANNAITPGWRCPDSPAQGSLHPSGRRFFLPAHYSDHHLWAFAAAALHNRSDLLICPPQGEIYSLQTSLSFLSLPPPRDISIFLSSRYD